MADSWDASIIKRGGKEVEAKIVEESPLPWNAPGHQPPINIISNSSEEPLGQSLIDASSSRYMKGQIIVGLVVASGSTDDLIFSYDEKILVIKEVIRGVQFLASLAPTTNFLTYTYQIKFLSIDAVPSISPCGTSAEFCESVWRDPVLKLLECKSGVGGYPQYNSRLKVSAKADWAYSVFFHKYPAFHFAYAYPSIGALCMQYANNSWGPEKLGEVFAHETCHIFGALDEYAPCNCDDVSGYIPVPNNNCVSCTGTHVPCVMDQNSLTMCSWTKGQIGLTFVVVEALGTTTVNNRPYTFAKCGDGNLWCNWWSGSAWTWISQGTPPSVKLMASMGATLVDGSRPYVFITGNDGHVWPQGFR